VHGVLLVDLTGPQHAVGERGGVDGVGIDLCLETHRIVLHVWVFTRCLGAIVVGVHLNSGLGCVDLHTSAAGFVLQHSSWEQLPRGVASKCEVVIKPTLGSANHMWDHLTQQHRPLEIEGCAIHRLNFTWSKSLKSQEIPIAGAQIEKIPVGICELLVGVKWSANTCTKCSRMESLHWPLRFQYVWFVRLTGVALSVVAWYSK